MAIIGGTKLNSILNGVELQICEVALNVVKANSDGNDQKKIDRLLKNSTRANRSAIWKFMISDHTY